MNTLISAAMPTVEKIVGSGKIDNMLRELKQSYRNSVNLSDEESVEILVSSENDGCEYLNVVVINFDMKIIRVLYQRKLSDAIVTLLKESKNANRNQE